MDGNDVSAETNGRSRDFSRAHFGRGSGAKPAVELARP